MCFSAHASFIAGTALSAAGVVTLRMTARRAEIPFAMIPLLFGIQQLVEGMIWLSFRDGSAWPNASLTLVFALFSHILWPIFVPFAVARLEVVPWRKNALAVSQIAGVTVGLYLLYFIVRFPVTSRVLGNHIVYQSPHFYVVGATLLYVVGAVGGCLLSGSKIIRAFGVLLLVTFAAAYAIHAATLISMWCFFAALMSVIVYLYFRTARSTAPPESRRRRVITTPPTASSTAAVR